MNHQPSIGLAMKITTLVAIVIPFLAVPVGMYLMLKWGMPWVHVWVAVGVYILTGLGITVGFHRLFTHCSFKTPKVVQAIFAVLGSMAVEGPLFRWVATHRQHHRHSDKEDDPHSPHLHGGGWKGFVKGLWHSHMGWMFKHTPNLEKSIPDLVRSRMLTWINRLFPLWVLVGLLVPTLLSGLLTMSWQGTLLGFILGGLARVFFVHHVTWSINSVCHLWGKQPFRSNDESRNNPIMGVIAMGEGWHNNHHAFPSSPRHGLLKWQIDVSFMVIRALEVVGLAWHLQVPSMEKMQARLRT
jgi:stearoyl-CoA desaturase (Delta-9 desaturase)